MDGWKIRTRIILGFAFVLILTMALGIFAYTRVLIMERSAQSIGGNEIPAVIALGHTQTEVYHIVELLRQHAASSDPREMDSLEAQIYDLRELNAKSFQAYEVLPTTPPELALYASVKAARADFWSALEQVRRVSRAGTKGGNAHANEMLENQLKPRLQKYVAALQLLLDFNNQGSQDGLALIQRSAKAADVGILFGVLLCIAIAVPINMLIVSSIAGPLSKAVAALDLVAAGDLTATVDVNTRDEVGQMAHALNAALAMLRATLLEVAESATTTKSSSQQLAAAAEEISGGAQQQAASLEETSASLEQITAAVRQTADNARQASQLATGSRESAETGQEVVSLAIGAMAEINTASAKISDIISTINEIAFQTNLLAVNAAVEAARAGEEGRGFAVVAAEVRSLAQRSADASKEIRVLIQDTLAKVEKGCELVNRSGTTLQGIVGSVKRVTDIVGQIAAASSEQSIGVDQVNSAVTQMDHITQSNSAQTEELASTAHTLAQQAARLTQLVDRFKLKGDSAAVEGDWKPKPLENETSMSPHHQAPHLQLARSAHLVADKFARATPKGRINIPPARGFAGVPAASSEDASFEEF